MKINKKTMEALKQQLINRSIESKRIKIIPLFQLIQRLKYNGKGLLNDFNVYEKMKLLELKNFELSRIGRK